MRVTLKLFNHFNDVLTFANRIFSGNSEDGHSDELAPTSTQTIGNIHKSSPTGALFS